MSTDIRQVLEDIYSELEISLDDTLIQREIDTIRRQIRESITTIDEINDNRQKYVRERDKERFMFKIIFPYMVYLHNLIDKTDKKIEFSPDFITEILQKHLEVIGNNGHKH